MTTIDPRCPWISYTNGTNVKVQAVDFVPAELSGGNLGLYVYAYRQKFQRWGVPFSLVLPGSRDDWATRPNFVIDMQGGGFDPGKGQAGPFEIVCGDASVRGMGLPLNRHVIYCISFVLSPAWNWQT